MLIELWLAKSRGQLLGGALRIFQIEIGRRGTIHFPKYRDIRDEDLLSASQGFEGRQAETLIARRHDQPEAGVQNLGEALVSNALFEVNKVAQSKLLDQIARWGECLTHEPKIRRSTPIEIAKFTVKFEQISLVLDPRIRPDVKNVWGASGIRTARTGKSLRCNGLTDNANFGFGSELAELFGSDSGVYAHDRHCPDAAEHRALIEPAEQTGQARSFQHAKCMSDPGGVMYESRALAARNCPQSRSICVIRRDDQIMSKLGD